MPLHRVQLKYGINESTARYKWSNLWYVNAAGPLEAAQVGTQIHAALRPAMQPTAFVYEVYASDLLPNTQNYVTMPIVGNQKGTMSSPGSEYMPSFCVVRIDLVHGGFGRPSRKFWRCPLTEGQSVAGELLPLTRTQISDAFLAVIAIAGVTDESGNDLVGASVRDITSRRLGKYAGNAVPATPAT